MVEVITETEEISGKIFKIIKSSSKNLYLVSPYIQLYEWSKLNDALSYVIKEKNVKVTIIARKKKKSTDSDPIEQLHDYLKICKVYLLSDLHSKVYYNGFQALITSMNMQQYSFEHNQEIGVFFSKEHETQLDSIYQHIQFLISTGEEYLTSDKKKKKKESLEKITPNKSTLIEFRVLSKGYKWLKVISPDGYENKILIEKAPGLKVDKTYEASIKKKWKETPYGFEVEFVDLKNLKKISGFCILCNKKIDFDPDKPLCKSCYFKNKQYFGHVFGKVCHYCGQKTAEILDSKPLCYSCYSKYQSYFV